MKNKKPRTPEEILQEVQDQNLHRDPNRCDWDSLWLAHAKLVSLRSNDARTKCGCVFVKDNRIVSVGYNGTIHGIDDTLLPNYEGHEDPTLSKYTYFCNHSERNAIFNAARVGVSVEGCTAYITGDPCIVCYQAMYQVGIKRIVIPNDPLTPICVQNKEHQEQLNLIQHLTKNALPIEKAECNINIAQV